MNRIIDVGAQIKTREASYLIKIKLLDIYLLNNRDSGLHQ